MGDDIDKTIAEIAERFLDYCNQLGWDVPAQLGIVDVRPANDGDLERISVAWEVRGPVAVGGHPFATLAAAEVPDSAVGVLLGVEGWMTVGDGIGRPGALESDLAAHSGPDGRAEIRQVVVLLRDGTSAQVCQVRGGQRHWLSDRIDGRIPAALRLLLGTPSGEGAEVDAPARLLKRAWVWLVCLVAGSLERDWGGALEAELDDEAHAMGPAGVALTMGCRRAFLEASLPAVLVRVARSGASDWPGALAALRAARASEHHLGWLLAGNTESDVLDDWSDDDELRARSWCDAGMLALLVHGCVPDEDTCEAAIVELLVRGLRIGREELAELAATALSSLSDTE